MPYKQFLYKFNFPDGRKQEYLVEVDSASGRLKPAEPKQNLEWTRLENAKCAHCPLNSKTHPHCPVAKNLSMVVQDFVNEKSYSKVDVEVHTEERIYKNTVSLQDGLFGLFGLIIATSECPYLDFLKPMAVFHLPFSTLTETMARSVSFYLMRQYFVAKNGGKPDISLDGLQKKYSDLREVNQGLLQRIRTVAVADADANSLLNLHCLGSLLTGQISIGLADLEPLFGVGKSTQ